VDNPAPAATQQRLLDSLRERLRYMHDSLRTEEAYVYWVRGFVRWSGLDGLMMTMGDEERAIVHGGGRGENGGDGRLRHSSGNAPIKPPRACEPLPCYRLTPSFTAEATSAF
jgi:hypothetical protein